MHKTRDSSKDSNLEFPNARLYVLLHATNSSASEAIVSAAAEFGLISRSSSNKVLGRTNNEHCQCMTAARSVIHQFFEETGTPTSLTAGEEERVWLSVTDQVCKSLANNDDDCSDLLQKDLAKHNCAKLAPILFDFVLQQIRRYH